MTRLMYAGLIGLLLSASVVAQQPASEKPKAEAPATVKASPAADKLTAPALTTEQKQAVQLVLQRLENAQLRAQLAGNDFEKARGDLGALVQGLQVPGFDLNLQTFEYSKKAEPPKADPPAKK